MPFANPSKQYANCAEECTLVGRKDMVLVVGMHSLTPNRHILKRFDINIVEDINSRFYNAHLHIRASAETFVSEYEDYE